MLQYIRRQSLSNFSIVVGVFFQQLIDENNTPSSTPLNNVWNTGTWKQKTVKATPEIGYFCNPVRQWEHGSAAYGQKKEE